jgi:flagellar biogenesis protein FliO
LCPIYQLTLLDNHSFRLITVYGGIWARFLLFSVHKDIWIALGMAESKKKIVVFVAAAVLVCGALMMRQTRPVSAEEQKSLFASSDSLILNEPNLSGQPAEKFQKSELFYKMTLVALLIVALGVAAIYISKRLVPKIARLPGKEIYIVETAHIGQRKAVHLLKIGDRMLLIGSTNESITKLADVTKALSNVSQQQQDSGLI